MPKPGLKEMVEQQREPRPDPGFESGALAAEEAPARPQRAPRPDPVAPTPRPAGTSAPAPGAAEPQPEDLDRFAINDWREGRQLYLVSLHGHRSRVMDADRQAPVYLEKLPVYAENQGQAWMFFQAYNGLVASMHQPVIELAPQQPQGA